MPLLHKLFGSSVDTLQSALNLRMQKQGIIQSNIANIETPGYKRQGFSFADAMGEAMQGRGTLTVTNQKHIRLDPLAISASSSVTSENRPVDLDEEMLQLAENQLMYQVTAQIITKKFEGLRTVIEEGGK